MILKRTIVVEPSVMEQNDVETNPKVIRQVLDEVDRE